MILKNFPIQRECLFVVVAVEVYDQIYFWYLTDLIFAAPTVLADIATSKAFGKDGILVQTWNELA